MGPGEGPQTSASDGCALGGHSRGAQGGAGGCSAWGGSWTFPGIFGSSCAASGRATGCTRFNGGRAFDAMVWAASSACGRAPSRPNWHSLGEPPWVPGSGRGHGGQRARGCKLGQLDFLFFYGRGGSRGSASLRPAAMPQLHRLGWAILFFGQLWRRSAPLAVGSVLIPFTLDLPTAQITSQRAPARPSRATHCGATLPQW